MRKLMTNWAVPAAFAVCALSACARQAEDCGGLRVTGAWVRTAPSGVTMQAGYFQVRNDGDTEVWVRGVTSADFARVSMHKSVNRDGEMHMAPVAGFRVAPGASHRFQPGGEHLMLFAQRGGAGAAGRLAFTMVCGPHKHGRLAFSAQLRSAPPAGAG